MNSIPFPFFQINIFKNMEKLFDTLHASIACSPPQMGRCANKFRVIKKPCGIGYTTRLDDSHRLSYA